MLALHTPFRGSVAGRMSKVQPEALFALFRDLASSSPSAEAPRDLRASAEIVGQAAQVCDGSAISDRHPLHLYPGNNRVSIYLSPSNVSENKRKSVVYLQGC